jgi:hypothetical protein
LLEKPPISKLKVFERQPKPIQNKIFAVFAHILQSYDLKNFNI